MELRVPVETLAVRCAWKLADQQHFSCCSRARELKLVELSALAIYDCARLTDKYVLYAQGATCQEVVGAGEPATGGRFESPDPSSWGHAVHSSLRLTSHNCLPPKDRLQPNTRGTSFYRGRTATIFVLEGPWLDCRQAFTVAELAGRPEHRIDDHNTSHDTRREGERPFGAWEQVHSHATTMALLYRGRKQGT